MKIENINRRNIRVKKPQSMSMQIQIKSDSLYFKNMMEKSENFKALAGKNYGTISKFVIDNKHLENIFSNDSKRESAIEYVNSLRLQKTQNVFKRRQTFEISPLRSRIDDNSDTIDSNYNKLIQQCSTDRGESNSKNLNIGNIFFDDKETPNKSKEFFYDNIREFNTQRNKVRKSAIITINRNKMLNSHDSKLEENIENEKKKIKTKDIYYRQRIKDAVNKVKLKHRDKSKSSIDAKENEVLHTEMNKKREEEIEIITKYKKPLIKLSQSNKGIINRKVVKKNDFEMEDKQNNEFIDQVIEMKVNPIQRNGHFANFCNGNSKLIGHSMKKLSFKEERKSMEMPKIEEESKIDFDDNISVDKKDEMSFDDPIILSIIKSKAISKKKKKSPTKRNFDENYSLSIKFKTIKLKSNKRYKK